MPEGRKNYSKTKPIQYEEFADCLKWWGKRKENDRAWKVKASDVIKMDDDGNVVSVNLDIKNPNGGGDAEVVQPCQVVGSLIAEQKEILRIASEAAERYPKSKRQTTRTGRPLNCARFFAS